MKKLKKQLKPGKQASPEKGAERAVDSTLSKAGRKPKKVTKKTRTF